MNEAILIGVGSLITAAVGGILAIINNWSANRARERKTSLDEWQDIAGKLQTQITRLEKQIESQQVCIYQIYQHSNDCEIEFTDMYGHLIRMRELAVHQANAIKKLGVECEAIPDLPPRRDRKPIDIGFLHRTVQQDVALAKEVDKRIAKDAAQEATR